MEARPLVESHGAWFVQPCAGLISDSLDVSAPLLVFVDPLLLLSATIVASSHLSFGIAVEEEEEEQLERWFGGSSPKGYALKWE